MPTYQEALKEEFAIALLCFSNFFFAINTACLVEIVKMLKRCYSGRVFSSPPLMFSFSFHPAPFFDLLAP